MAIVLFISIGMSRANAEEVLPLDCIGPVPTKEKIAWPQMEQMHIVRGHVENPDVESGDNGVPWLPSAIQCRNLLKMCAEFHNITN